MYALIQSKGPDQGVVISKHTSFDDASEAAGIDERVVKLQQLVAPGEFVDFEGLRCAGVADRFSMTSYINQFYEGSQKLFAKHLGVKPQQISEWKRKRFIVIEHFIYAPRRKLPTPKKGPNDD